MLFKYSLVDICFIGSVLGAIDDMILLHFLSSNFSYLMIPYSCEVSHLRSKL